MTTRKSKIYLVKHTTQVKNNSKRITEIEDKNKWLGRAVIGAVICELVGLGFMFFSSWNRRLTWNNL